MASKLKLSRRIPYLGLYMHRHAAVERAIANEFDCELTHILEHRVVCRIEVDVNNVLLARLLRALCSQRRRAVLSVRVSLLMPFEWRTARQLLGGLWKEKEDRVSLRCQVEREN